MVFQFFSQQYGDIRTLYTACKHRGFVMISYYDIRAARTAMRSLQNKPLRRRKLDIHFSIPKVFYKLKVLVIYFFIDWIPWHYYSLGFLFFHIPGQSIRQGYQPGNIGSFQFGSICFKWRPASNIWGLWRGQRGDYFILSCCFVSLSHLCVYVFYF